MTRILKALLYILLALVLLVAAAVFIITQIIDPNDFKDDISALAKEHANIELNIEGDIGWTFWPSLGLKVGHTEAHIVDQKPRFAAIDNLEVGVAVIPLFRKQVELDAIRLDGMDVNIINDENGANWEALIPDDDDKAAEKEKEKVDQETDLDIPISIPLISITNAKVNYVDKVEGTDITIDDLELEARDVSFKEDFPVVVKMRYQDQDDMRITLDLDTQVNSNLKNNQYRLAPLSAKVSLAGILDKPVDVALNAGVLADLDADKLEVSDISIRALGTETTGAVTVNQMTEDFSLAGRIKTAPFNANKLLKAIGEEPIETANSDALSKISLDATLAGPANSVIMDPLVIQLDDSTIKGKAGISDLDALALMFDLTLDKIKLDDYLPPQPEEEVAEATEESAPPEPLSEEDLLPLELLRDLNVKGKLRINNMLFDDLEIRNLLATVDAAKGIIVQTSEGEVLDGSFNTHANIDARTDDPKIEARIISDKVQVQQIVQRVLQKDLLLGILDSNVDIKTHGNSEKALFENLNGKINLGFLDAIVRGLNLHGSLADGVNEMLSSMPQLAEHVSKLAPSDLPKELREDTKILDLNSDSRIENGVAHIDTLDARLERGGSMTGGGNLNLITNDFDFKINLGSGEMFRNKHLDNREWPIHCSGNLNGNAARWCLPKSDELKSVGKKLIKQIAKDKLGIDEERIAKEKEKAEAKLKEERARLDAKKEEEKEKLKAKADEKKEKAKEKAKDKLKKLF